MTDELPNAGERVEILHNGEWVPATFVLADYYIMDDGDEVWWLHYYRLDDGLTTVPDDIQRPDKLPPWRRING